MKMKSIFIFLFAFVFAATGFGQSKPEFRAVWISTVSNIDWPKNGEWDSDKQKESFIRLLNKYKADGFNAVIVQIRPAGDAFTLRHTNPGANGLQAHKARLLFLTTIH
jgi:uncharacterized lipoprotein YddW (UPF0748 family)